MAGYIFNLNDRSALDHCMRKGVYGTIIGNIRYNGTWGITQEGTFADYASMKEGDLVFFFIKRKIYGIGRLKNLHIDGNATDCKFLNYPNADKPFNFKWHNVPFLRSVNPHQSFMWSTGPFLDKVDFHQRFICVFEPYPGFYEEGIDMDDALVSNAECFNMLRAFWKVSFLKLDDTEANCLFDVLLKNCYFDSRGIVPDHRKKHREIARKLNSNYLLNANNILDYAAIGDKLKHEMALEAGLMFQLSSHHGHTQDIFGKWDYISHQVIASPFKPIDYMDKIDIYGYSYIEGFQTKDKYLIMELKKDKAIGEDIEQLMKYVDWVKEKYSGQDYTSITAYLVAYEFEPSVHSYLSSHGSRNYIIGRRPARTGVWDNIKLVEYRYDRTNKELRFRKI